MEKMHAHQQGSAPPGASTETDNRWRPPAISIAAGAHAHGLLYKSSRLRWRGHGLLYKSSRLRWRGSGWHDCKLRPCYSVPCASVT
jgi:hypothetical protein